MLENFLSGVGRALVTVELNTERAIPHPCAWCQQCRPATPEALAATAYHDHTVKFLSPLPSRFVVHAIGLQKMHWTCRTGFPEHTDVSLKEHMPNNPRGGYPPCVSGYSSVVRPSKTFSVGFSTPISVMMCDWCGASPC